MNRREFIISVHQMNLWKYYCKVTEVIKLHEMFSWNLFLTSFGVLKLCFINVKQTKQPKNLWHWENNIFLRYMTAKHQSYNKAQLSSSTTYPYWNCYPVALHYVFYVLYRAGWPLLQVSQGKVNMPICRKSPVGKKTQRPC